MSMLSDGILVERTEEVAAGTRFLLPDPEHFLSHPPDYVKMRGMS